MNGIRIPEMYKMATLTENSNIQLINEQECKEVLDTYLNDNKVYLMGKERTIIAVISNNFMDMFKNISIVNNHNLLNVLVNLRLELKNLRKTKSMEEIIDRVLRDDVIDINKDIISFIKELQKQFFVVSQVINVRLENGDMDLLFNYYTTVNNFKLVLRKDEDVLSRYKEIVCMGNVLSYISYNEKLYPYIEIKAEGGVPKLKITHYKFTNKADSGGLSNPEDDVGTDIDSIDDIDMDDIDIYSDIDTYGGTDTYGDIDTYSELSNQDLEKLGNSLYKVKKQLVYDTSNEYLIDVDEFKALMPCIDEPKVFNVQEEDIPTNLLYKCTVTGFRRGSDIQAKAMSILGLDRRL